MALITTSWVMGSAAGVPATTIEVTAGGVTESIVLPAGDYYPWDSSAVYSALNQLHDALESHSQIGACSAFIGRDRSLRFNCDVAYSIDSWSDLTIRNVIGFVGGEAFAATNHTAPSSAYLWSPGRTEIPDAPLGSQGLPYTDTARGMSGDAVVVATTTNTGRKNRFRWRLVPVDRVLTSAEAPREFVRFWQLMVPTFSRWKVYRDVTEESVSVDDTQVNMGVIDVVGPYKVANPSGPLEFQFDRRIERVDLFSDVELPAILTPEY